MKPYTLVELNPNILVQDVERIGIIKLHSRPRLNTPDDCKCQNGDTRAVYEDFLRQNSEQIRSNLRNSEQIRSKKSGDNYVLEAPRTGKIAWSSCLQSPARLGCSILLRFHSNPPDSRAYWYKSVTNS